MATVYEEKAGTVEGHPSQEKADRYPRDRVLRAHGFTIHARPTGKPPLWARRGEVYTEREARKIAQREAKG